MILQRNNKRYYVKSYHGNITEEEDNGNAWQQI